MLQSLHRPRPPHPPATLSGSWDLVASKPPHATAATLTCQLSHIPKTLILALARVAFSRLIFFGPALRTTYLHALEYSGNFLPLQPSAHRWTSPTGRLAHRGMTHPSGQATLISSCCAALLGVTSTDVVHLSSLTAASVAAARGPTGADETCHLAHRPT